MTGSATSGGHRYLAVAEPVKGFETRCADTGRGVVGALIHTPVGTVGVEAACARSAQGGPRRRRSGPRRGRHPGIGQPVVDIVWSVETESAVMVLGVVPREEPGAEATRILDGAEPRGEGRSVLEGLELRLGVGVVLGGVGPGVGLKDLELGLAVPGAVTQLADRFRGDEVSGKGAGPPPGLLPARCAVRRGCGAGGAGPGASTLVR